MIDNLIFLSTPITVLILLTGILSYFGNHILSRGIIFIDIAVAQIAALGTMIGLLLGFTEGSVSVQVISYAFTLIVIGVFSMTRFEKQAVPQEAIIGIIYCLALGLAMFFAEKIPGGSNYITKTITGNILWVTWKQALYCFLVFAGIGIIHIFLGKKFIMVSDNSKNFPFSPKKVRLYEFIFYITFGIVIVKAVPIGGVFLIFTLLIAPTAAATLFTQNWKKRFIWSWVIGIIGSIAGVYISYTFNISNGPAVVCLLGLIVLIFAFIKLFSKRSSQPA